MGKSLQVLVVHNEEVSGVGLFQCSCLNSQKKTEREPSQTIVLKDLSLNLLT